MTNPYVPSVYIPPTGVVVPKLDPKTVKVGDEIPKLNRYGDYQLWNRYAAVNYEFAGHHMDDSVGHHEGFEAAIGMGPFIHALLHVLLREWVGEERGRVVKVGMQSRRPWIRGRTLSEGGKVTALREENGELIVSLEVWGDNDKGERLVIGEAEVALPA
jgi:hypothetical protein